MYYSGKSYYYSPRKLTWAKNESKKNLNSNSHNLLPKSESAVKSFTLVQKIFIANILLTIIAGFLLNFHLTLIFLIAFLTTIYFVDLIFNFYLIAISSTRSAEINISDKEIERIDESNLPVYTILCPLYKEWKTLPQFINGISNLSYPKDKIQVLILLEEDDKKTIQNASDLSLPSYFEILIVPDSKPKTKPKALNFGLSHARGEYIVIYDAEDIPERFQLKKAVIAFRKSSYQIKCIQAKLNFYNTHQNILTRIFTAEYSLWFEMVLTGLQSIQAPIPLGGTSNHFRTQDILDLKGWDAFNVTEDADLGMRIARKGFLTAIINSTTYEEANSNIFNWFWQRSRWIKGYMQTYLVHMRRPLKFARKNSIQFLFFQIVIGAKIAAILINPIMWVLTFMYFAFRSDIGTYIEALFPQPIFYMGIISLFLGNFLYMYYYMIGCARRGKYSVIKYVFFVPLYWLAISLSAYFSFYKLLVNPHHWSKTIHGLHIDQSKKSEALSI